jgi:large subunit ribosomal protein L46
LHELFLHKKRSSLSKEEFLHPFITSATFKLRSGLYVMISLRRLLVSEVFDPAIYDAIGRRAPSIAGSFAGPIGLPQPTCLAAFASAAFSKKPTPSIASGPYYSACVFERLPIIMPLPAEWEMEYAAWRQKFQERRQKKLPSQLVEEKKVVEDALNPSMEVQWTPAPRETAADRSGDRTSLRRRLDQRIFMLLHCADQGNDGWEFPCVQLEEEETTRAGAERALREALGSDGFQPYFVGNAPAGHAAYAGEGGGTVFFHRCQLIQGRPGITTDAARRWKELVWAAKDEFAEYISHDETLKILQKML